MCVRYRSDAIDSWVIRKYVCTHLGLNKWHPLEADSQQESSQQDCPQVQLLECWRSSSGHQTDSGLHDLIWRQFRFVGFYRVKVVNIRFWDLLLFNQGSTHLRQSRFRNPPGFRRRNRSKSGTIHGCSSSSREHATLHVATPAGEWSSRCSPCYCGDASAALKQCSNEGTES